MRKARLRARREAYIAIHGPPKTKREQKLELMAERKKAKAAKKIVKREQKLLAKKAVEELLASNGGGVEGTIQKIDPSQLSKDEQLILKRMHIGSPP